VNKEIPLIFVEFPYQCNFSFFSELLLERVKPFAVEAHKLNKTSFREDKLNNKVIKKNPFCV